jgi:hypothetical protein
MYIVLFEDSKRYEHALVEAIARELGERGQATLFVPGDRDGTECIHEKLLEREIAARYPNATLLVADRDLSAMRLYPGLSEQIVKAVANKLGIAECAYARGERAVHGIIGPDFKEGEIAVSLAEDNLEQFAKQVVAVGAGFLQVSQALQRVLKRGKQRSPGRVLAAILEKPEYAEKISLFASGDQGRLEGVLKVRGSEEERERRLTLLFGYWLWDSVLRYPGVITNEVASASYLNVSVDEFRTDDVRQLFAAARYVGPFSDAIGPLWWRGMLDDIVAGSRARDGREFVERSLGRAVARSACVEDPQISAGYYCMLTGQSVSLENSKPGLAWFPRGADLARISKTRYDEVVPWLAA